MSEGANKFEATFLRGDVVDVEIHPGEPERLNFCVESFGDVLGDRLMVGTKNVVELGDHA